MKFLLAILFAILYTLQITEASTKNDYVLYVFEREWAGSVCKHKKCKKSYVLNHQGKEFNIHGLWPSGRPGDINYHMMNCDDSFEYNQREIGKDLLTWMNEEYVGLYNPSIPFRAHEFEKHGSCYNYENNVKTNAQKENAFFTRIKEVNELYPLMSTLADAEIVPSDENKYQIKDIESALMEGFNTTHRPNVGCQNVKGGRQVMETVQICLDLNFDIIDCPRYKNNCRPNKPVYFPVFNYKGLRSTGFLEQVEEVVEDVIEGLY